MLDIQFIREHADVVKESQRKRGESVELVDEVLRSDEVRRSSLKEFEAARAQQKEIGKKVAAAPADEKAKLIAQFSYSVRMLLTCVVAILGFQLGALNGVATALALFFPRITISVMQLLGFYKPQPKEAPAA